MDYELAWKEMKSWLKSGIAYLEQRKKEVKGEERKRIKNKLEGLQISLQHIYESEKIYNKAKEGES